MTTFPMIREVRYYLETRMFAIQIWNSIQDDVGNYDTRDLEYYDDQTYYSQGDMYEVFGLDIDQMDINPDSA